MLGGLFVKPLAIVHDAPTVFVSLTPFCRDTVSGSCFTGQLIFSQPWTIAIFSAMWTIAFGNQTSETEGITGRVLEHFVRVGLPTMYAVKCLRQVQTYDPHCNSVLSIRRFAVNRCFSTLVRGRKPFCSSGCSASNIFSTAKDQIGKRVVDKFFLVVRKSVW